jgi:hypothetical protein
MRAVLRARAPMGLDRSAPTRQPISECAKPDACSSSDHSLPAIPGLGDPRIIEGPGDMLDGRFSPMPFLVPHVDADGNEVAGIRVPEVAVPLATTTGWNFRAERIGNPTTIVALLGSYVPFARTKAERDARRDPRLSIEERYKAATNIFSGYVRLRMHS